MVDSKASSFPKSFSQILGKPNFIFNDKNAHGISMGQQTKSETCEYIPPRASIPRRGAHSLLFASEWKTISSPNVIMQGDGQNKHKAAKAYMLL
jgi:hypothetical protein